MITPVEALQRLRNAVESGEPDAEFDVIAAITDLVELSGTEAVDLAHLDRGGPVIREPALVGSVALYESEPGALAEAQVVAIAERIETDPMRRLNLQLLASSHREGA